MGLTTQESMPGSPKNSRGCGFLDVCDAAIPGDCKSGDGCPLLPSTGAVRGKQG